MAHTLWEEGRHPGALVVSGVAAALGVAVLLQLAVGDHLGWFFDLVLVAACVAAALLVRPRDFFAVGVLPPLALGGTVLLLVLVDRSAVARASDGVLQALVSGIAHHAVALAIAYALTLAVLGLRQVALRNQGRLRRPQHEHEAMPGPAPAARPSRTPERTPDAAAASRATDDGEDTAYVPFPTDDESDSPAPVS